MTYHLENLEGASCVELPIEAVERYFYANISTERKLAEVAFNICANCPVIQECYNRVINGAYKLNGITAGLSKTRINILRRWQKFDLGITDHEPAIERPNIEIPGTTPKSSAMANADEYRRQVDLSFEERVYEVFQDIREQKITKINEAIGKIGLIHSEFMERES